MHDSPDKKSQNSCSSRPVGGYKQFKTLIGPASGRKAASFEESYTSEEIDENSQVPERNTPPDSEVADTSHKHKSQLFPHEVWNRRIGHGLTFAGIFAFTVVLYFRPNESISALSGLSSLAFILAVATLLIYFPSQYILEGSITAFPIEVKCVLFMAFWALVTIPIAKDPSLAWETFSDPYVKVVLIFVVMVNCLRTRERLRRLMWLGVTASVFLAFQAVDSYARGDFRTEGYRVSVELGGMFGNSNDLAMFLTIFAPIAVILGIVAKGKLGTLVGFASAGLIVAGVIVTQSRGGFLSLVAVTILLVRKFSRRSGFKVIVVTLVIGAGVIAFAPGNYGLRIMSIFDPSLDPNGSSTMRKESLEQSLLVTLRNPAGIGLAGSLIVGVRNTQTHNAYTQVSSELGWLAFAAYMILLISPYRKLRKIERHAFSESDSSWIYYMSIGIQGSIAAYMVSSFFSSGAYQWYVYYPIAYAVGLRRIFSVEEDRPLLCPVSEDTESQLPGKSFR